MVRSGPPTEKNLLTDWMNLIVSLFLFLLLPSASVLLAGIAALMFAVNLREFAGWTNDKNDQVDDSDLPEVSILIPARDEEASIERAVRAGLASRGVECEVIVLNDGSSDATGDIVRRLASEDARVRLIEGIELPDRWNGKQHACFRLAGAARYDLLMFLDADVRLHPDAARLLIRRKSMRLGGEPVALLSAFPRQETGTILEKMLIPMMQFLLLCYLPFSRMRSSSHPAYASGCGQLFLTDRTSYTRAGTHEAIRSSRHDGLQLPKAFRRNAMMTDCVDGTDLATCRMYTNASQVIRGLLKNADEGIANARLLIPFTVLLGVANLVPWVTLALSVEAYSSGVQGFQVFAGILLSLMAIVLSYQPRIMAVVALKQSGVGAALHPLAIALFLAIQWWAFLNALRGKRVAWRGRV